MYVNHHENLEYALSEDDPNTPISAWEAFRIVSLVIMTIVIIPIFAMTTVIRYYTFLDPAAYSDPCNFTGLESLNHLRNLNNQKDEYNRILKKDTWKNDVGGMRIHEIEYARQRKLEIMKEINVQTEYRQKCAGINIRKDQKNIMEKPLFWLTWLFRFGSILVLIYALILYKFRKIMERFLRLSILTADLIISTFICAGFSLSDYLFIKNFDEKLIDFGYCLLCYFRHYYNQT